MKSDDNYTQKDYDMDFPKHSKKRERALEHALDIRKFEIGLYWERAKYFWTFIVAAMGGYGTIQALDIDNYNKADLSVYICCLGIVFSFGWYCVNKGSKQWQENWENHVDLLEDKTIGPLYKVVLKRKPPTSCKATIKENITGPGSYSVSKINQIISLYVFILWIFFLWISLPAFDKCADINWRYVFVIVLTVIACAAFYSPLGRTDNVSYHLIAKKRGLKYINNKSN